MTCCSSHKNPVVRSVSGHLLCDLVERLGGAGVLDGGGTWQTGSWELRLSSCRTAQQTLGTQYTDQTFGSHLVRHYTEASGTGENILQSGSFPTSMLGIEPLTTD